MLESLRQMSKGWVMKVVLGLLALTFVVFFGASDFGGGHGGGHGSRNTNAVVEVDDVDYSLHQVGRAFNSQIQQIAQVSGQQIDPQSPLAASVLDQAIDTMVTRTLFDLAARDLGVSSSDFAVQDAIRRVPAFSNPGGGFDRTLFRNYLLSVGLSEQQFVASAREDLQRSQYLGTLRTGITVPEPMLDAFYAYRSEQRIVELATVTSASVEGLSQPDEAQLAAFYEENKELFRAPEYRAATVAALTVQELADSIVVDEQEIAEFYADRLNAFQQPERRELLQGIFLDQDSAQRAADMIAQGRPFAEAIEEVAGFPPVALGDVQRGQISEAEVADAAFAAAAGDVVGPIESPLGWQLVSVVAVQPEETQPLSEVSERIGQALALEEARDEIFDVMNELEDGLAAGASLEEVAQQTGLKLQKLEPFNVGALKRDGNPISIEPVAAVVSAVFTTDAGEVGEVVETQTGGFFVVRVDSITPPQIEPFERVRDRVTLAWLDHERLRLATERASELADRVRGGGNLAELAAEYGATFETTQPFDRTGLGSTIPGPLIGPIFEAAVGDVVQAQVQNGVGVARLVEIRGIDAGVDEFVLDELREQLAEGINRDIAQQLTAALRDRYSIDIDRDTIEESLLPQ